MAEKTKIEWTESPWNPWLGCSPVHCGCDNCYAQVYFTRMGIVGKRRKTSDANWKKPLAWERKAAENGERRKVFLSLCDPFEKWEGRITDASGEVLLRCDNCGHYWPDNEAALKEICTCGRFKQRMPWASLDDLRADLGKLIRATPHLVWILLTKRPELVRGQEREFWPNVWLLYSASDQATLEAGLPHLLACRSLVPVLGLNFEPLLGSVTIPPEALAMLDWVIVGGESGKQARPCDIEWIRSIRDRCREASVAGFVKQFGSCCYDSHPFAGKASQGVRFRHPKGGDPAEWPEDLRVRETP